MVEVGIWYFLRGGGYLKKIFLKRPFELCYQCVSSVEGDDLNVFEHFYSVEDWQSMPWEHSNAY